MTELDLFAPPAPAAAVDPDRATLAVLLGRTPSELDRCDLYYDEWRARGIMRAGVSWKVYRDRRLAGTWNSFARERFPHQPEMIAEGEDGRQ